MSSLRTALTAIGAGLRTGLRAGLESLPLSLRELLRVCHLPPPDLGDIEPDDPDFFHTFEVWNPQGITYAHGDRWFLSSQHSVFRYAIGGADPFRPDAVRREMGVGIRDLVEAAGLDPDRYDHIGDLAYAQGLVFAPIRRVGGGEPHIIMGLSENLQQEAWGELALSASDALCAIHPWNGLLYVASSEELQAYDIGAFLGALSQPPSGWGRKVLLPRRDEASIRLKTPSGAPDLQGGQGMVFSPNGRIYITRSHDRWYGWDNHLYVYSALTGIRLGGYREYDFAGAWDEIEGITIHPSGVIYVAVSDNDVDNDDFDLYTFRFRHLPPDAV